MRAIMQKWRQKAIGPPFGGPIESYCLVKRTALELDHDGKRGCELVFDQVREPHIARVVRVAYSLRYRAVRFHGHHVTRQVDGPGAGRYDSGRRAVRANVLPRYS